MSKESCKAGDDFIVALLNVFSRMNSVPKALTLILEPYLEQAHLWTHLHTLAGKFEADYSDTVLSILRECLFVCFFFLFGPCATEVAFTLQWKKDYFSTYTDVSSHSRRLFPINNTGKSVTGKSETQATLKISLFSPGNEFLSKQLYQFSLALISYSQSLRSHIC